MGRCEACGGWTRRDTREAAVCAACAAPIDVAAFRDCITPAAFRTDFNPVKIGEEELRIVRARVVCAEASPVRPMPVPGEHVGIALDRAANVIRLNPGGSGAGIFDGGFDLVTGNQRFFRPGRPRLELHNQALSDEAATGLKGAWTTSDRTGLIWLASRKVTDSLFLTPLSMRRELNLGAVAGDTTVTAVRAAALTMAFLLVDRAALELDVDPAEFEILPPRVARIADQDWPIIQVADTLVNGSGLSRHLSLPHDRPWAIDLLRDIVDSPSAWPLRDFTAPSHRRHCDQACYECLQRYGNRSYHGLLDWRLGLAYVRAFLDPTNLAGGDGDFSTSELADWRDLTRDALIRVARGSRHVTPIDDGPLPAARVSTACGEVTIVVHHPLWRVEGPDVAPLVAQALAHHPDARWLDGFELARRPFVAISRLSGGDGRAPRSPK